MAEKKYIDGSELLSLIPHIDGETTIQCVERAVEQCVPADVVARSAYDQTKWERDTAIQQLADAGIPFGGKAAAPLSVIHIHPGDDTEIPPADKVKAVHIGRGEGVPPREYAPVIRCEDCEFWRYVRPDAILDFDHGECICEKWEDSDGYSRRATTSEDFCSFGKMEEATP